MGIGTKFDVPVLGAVNFKYYPKIDSTKNADNNASENADPAVGGGSSLSIKTNLGDLPVVGSFLDGFTLTSELQSTMKITQQIQMMHSKLQ